MTEINEEFISGIHVYVTSDFVGGVFRYVLHDWSIGRFANSITQLGRSSLRFRQVISPYAAHILPKLPTWPKFQTARREPKKSYSR